MYVSPLNLFKRAEIWASKMMFKPFWETIVGALVSDTGKKVIGNVAGSLVSGAFGSNAADTNAEAQQNIADAQIAASAPYNTSGMFGQATFDQDNRTAETTLSPEFQALYGRFGARAEDIGSEISNLNPEALQQKFYNEQRALFAPQQERDRLALESRLLGQGMLGSTGGATRMGALLEAQKMQDLTRQAGAFADSQAFQDLLRTRETQDVGKQIKIGALPDGYLDSGRGLGTAQGSATLFGSGLMSKAALGQAGATANFGAQLGKNFSGMFSSDDNETKYKRNDDGEFVVIR